MYKAKQRGASKETIAANQARVDAAQAEKAKRQGTKTTEAEAENVAAALDGGVDEASASEM